MPSTTDATRPWWRDAVCYQIYVRSFADGNGDGIGDLPGVTSRLPYITSLGVDAVWLTPFYTSPQHDHGYDVADYCDVDPLFGTLADADDPDRRAPRAGPEDHRRPRAQPHLLRARVVQGGACLGPRQPRARSLPLPRRPRRQRRRPPTTSSPSWAAALGPGSRTTAPRPVVPPPLRLESARPQLAQPRDRRHVRVGAALLARPRRRRIPDRRGARAVQGGGPARQTRRRDDPDEVSRRPSPTTAHSMVD